jgi:hypothetical protein
MRAVRRFYFYLVTLISLEVVLWGIYSILSSIWNAPTAAGMNTLISQGLAQIIIGFPFFWLHWRTVKQDANQNIEEKQSYIRAIFMYGLYLATLIPIIISITTLLRCLFLNLAASTSAYQSYISTHQPLDSVTSILLNGLVWFAVYRMLKQEWNQQPIPQSLQHIRRIYRYVWLILGIGFLVSGIQLLFNNLLTSIPEWEVINNTSQIYNITQTLVAVILWAYTWQIIRSSFLEDNEKKSILRVVIFLGITWISTAFVLSLCGILINPLIQWALGEKFTLISFINQYANSIASLLPFAVLWGYYGKQLKGTFLDEPNIPRQKGLQRLHSTVLALAGNIVTFIGCWTLLVLLVDAIFAKNIMGAGMRVQFSSGLAELIIGIPLWYSHWKILQKDATTLDEFGQHARHSTIRKAYLYLIIFAAVIGLMAAGGILIYQGSIAILGNPMDDLFYICVKQIFLISLILVWFSYHRSSLQQDQKSIQSTLAERYASFPVLILEQAEDIQFFDQLKTLITHQLSGLPVKRISPEENDLIEIDEKITALIITNKHLLSLSEPIRKQIQTFSGRLIIIPISPDSVTIIGYSTKSMPELVKATTNTLQHMAELRTSEAVPVLNGWAIAGYIFGAIITLYLLLMLFASFYIP